MHVLNAIGIVNLFPVSNGMTRFWTVQLCAKHKAGPSVVQLRVNGIPAAVPGGAALVVHPTQPVQQDGFHLLLSDGDAVSVEVSGAPVDLDWGATVDVNDQG